MSHRILPLARGARARWLLLGLCWLALTGVPAQAADRPDLGAAGGALQAGPVEATLTAAERALAEARAAGDAAAEAQALLGVADAYLVLGRPAPALERIEKARALAARTGDAALAAQVAGAQGSAEVLAGRTEEGRATLERALTLAEQAGRPEQAARVGNDLGNLLAGQGQHAQAERLYRRALEQARAAGDTEQTALVAVNAARVLRDAGRERESAPLLALAEESAGRLGPSQTRTAVLISVARLQAGSKARGARERALANLAAAAESARATGDERMLSYALGYRAELESAGGRPAAALADSRNAAHRAQLAAAPESLYRWQWQTARLLRSQGDEEGAVAAYWLAIGTLESVRRDLAAADRAGTLRDQSAPLFAELVDLLVTRAGRSSGAAAQAELEAIRDLLERLKAAELEEYFRDDCVASLRTKTRGIDRLAPGTAALYPVVLPDRLVLLLKLPDGLRLHTTRVRAEELARETRVLRSALEKRTTREYLRPARKVYDWLVRPLHDDLRGAGVTTLVFVPDGVLRTVPLVALHDGQDFLATRYAVATSPGLTLTDARPSAGTKPRILIGGLTESVQGFPPLPSVADEVAALDTLYDGTILMDRRFDARGFRRAMDTRPYSIVHMASHGDFGGSADYTFILTHDSRITLDQLEVQLGGTAYRKQPVELLVLSACQTAAGDDRAALGLGGIAVKAGAQSALGALWSVSDRASAQLIGEFYRRLQEPGVNKAEALQAAQRRLLADDRYRHPAYWAPFLLIGNWL
jgi:CHAT domain-containing protein